MKHTLPFLLFIVVLIGCNKNPNVIPKQGITESSTREQDNAYLSKLRSEIQDLSNSETCTNGSDWKITPIGSKACGGPTEFVPYSKKINEQSFLNKVEKYTSEQRVYNQKWGMVSDCSLPAQPSAVECKNGKPVLVY